MHLLTIKMHFLTSRTVFYIFYLPLTIVGFTSDCVAKRHSKLLKQERKEKNQTVIKTDDEKLKIALGKQTKNMSFEEARMAKMYYEKEKEPDMIIKCAQRMLALGGSEQEDLRIARLDLAQRFLDKKDFTQAERYAQEYQKYYPGSDDAKKALYIAIQANYMAKLNADRDQAKTVEALKLAKQFLESYPQDTDYKEHVSKMQKECYQTIIRSEINIIQIQLSRYHITSRESLLKAAQKRVEFIKQEYMPQLPASQKKIQSLERQITTLMAQVTVPADKTAPVTGSVDKKASADKMLPVDKTTPADKKFADKDEIILAYAPQKNKGNRKNKDGIVKHLQRAFYEDNELYFA